MLTEWQIAKRDERYQVLDLKLGPLTVSETFLHGGYSTNGHAHDWPEVYVCNSGSGTLYLDGKPHSLEPGARYVVEGGVHHRVNTASGVVFTCVFEGERGLLNG